MMTKQAEAVETAMTMILMKVLRRSKQRPKVREERRKEEMQLNNKSANNNDKYLIKFVKILFV